MKIASVTIRIVLLLDQELTNSRRLRKTELDLRTN